jgi:hypothetical protein
MEWEWTTGNREKGRKGDRREIFFMKILLVS